MAPMKAMAKAKAKVKGKTTAKSNAMKSKVEVKVKAKMMKVKGKGAAKGKANATKSMKKSRGRGTRSSETAKRGARVRKGEWGRQRQTLTKKVMLNAAAHTRDEGKSAAWTEGRKVGFEEALTEVLYGFALESRVRGRKPQHRHLAHLEESDLDMVSAIDKTQRLRDIYGAWQGL